MSTPLSRRALGGVAAGAAAAAALGATAPAAQAAAAADPRERPFRAAHPRRHSRRPNILFILGDDLGWADLSSYGSPHIRTPHLDRLAREGVRFTDAYSGSATCSPTRFSLYTGRYPGRTKGGLAEP
ncbi:sulfatase family protein, partial [Streptomyces massasporeus]